MNAGASVARGDVLLFLHADTKLPANADALIRDGLAQSAASGAASTSASTTAGLCRLIAVMMNLRSRLTGIATGDQAIFVTRAAFDAIGGFPAQPLMEDIAFSASIRRISRPLCLRARVTTSARRWRKQGVLRTVFLMWRLRLAYFLGADPAQLARPYGYADRYSVSIAILAKAPIPGAVKTRLIPTIGAHAAAVLQERLTERAIATALAADVGPVTLWCSPDATHSTFLKLVMQQRIILKRQPEGDLGARMLAATPPATAVLVIGTDCPALTELHLRGAAMPARGDADVVIIPAEDGGYVLIGTRTSQPAIFSGIAWGTNAVLAGNPRASSSSAWLIEQPPLWDVDTEDDLARLEREFPELKL